MARIVRRKWGWYFTILDRKHFKVKLLWFWKGKACSMQYHKQRNELWLFLSGLGHLACETPLGELRCQTMENGTHTFIPNMKKHKFEALKDSLILEIQFGDKCIEEDIVRV